MADSDSPTISGQEVSPEETSESDLHPEKLSETKPKPSKSGKSKFQWGFGIGIHPTNIRPLWLTPLHREVKIDCYYLSCADHCSFSWRNSMKSGSSRRSSWSMLRSGWRSSDWIERDTVNIRPDRAFVRVLQPKRNFFLNSPCIFSFL